MDLLNELNAAQRAAVEYIDGPELVIAGAGSGKTRVLTYKIAYLLSQGMGPWNIMALTFTNKAAREMRERIGRLVGEESAKDLWMGTFHSVFGKILRREAEKIGFTRNYTIYTDEDSQHLMKNIMDELGVDKKKLDPKKVLSVISRAKERLQTPEIYAHDTHTIDERRKYAKMADLAHLYKLYQERMKRANAMDFDDMLMHTYYLFKQHEDVCQRYAQNFQYILVDEYQDTNFAQHAIVKLLVSIHGRLCVVGDDAQSIYSFRGAKIENILNLGDTFQKLRIFKLEQNYRSTQTIVNAANSVIDKNQFQYKKNVFSEKAQGEPITLYVAKRDVQEAERVARRIDSLCSDKYKFEDIAILYRTNAQSRCLEDALRTAHIPYRIYGGMSFYQRKEIKDVLAYCRMAVNPSDEEALRRIINYPKRGIGKTTVDKLALAAADAGLSIWEMLCELPDSLPFNGGVHKKLTDFQTMMNHFVVMAEGTDAYTLMETIVKESGIQNDLVTSSDIDAKDRRENVNELLGAARTFSEQEDNTMASYIQEVALISDMDRADENPNRVSLMTIHASKGLEFPVVFITGMEEEIFPGNFDTTKQLEEERRLFYVALTRAGDQCYLTHCQERFVYGQFKFSTPSRFLKDIDPKFLKGITVKSESPAFAIRTSYSMPKPIFKPVAQMKKEALTAQNRPVSDSRELNFHVGQAVYHEIFKGGKVIEVEGTGIDTKVTVEFENIGTKQLLAKFAKLKTLT